ncbi:MAG: nucleotidyltransferase family protein [Acutalibacteraceae bacterium]
MNYGVIAEFNPFHNGHKYLLEQLKGDCNTISVCMSESFVQRGESAICSPYARTKMALECGADLVLSLPLPFATSSAEKFAVGGVSVLGSLGVIDALAFGSETGETKNLIKCADCLNSEEFKKSLENTLTSGESFPAIRQKVITELLGEEIGNVLSSPNDILAVEYIKAVKSLGFDMSFTPIKRKAVDHNSSNVIDNICSASHLRRIVQGEKEYKSLMPRESFNILIDEISKGKAPCDFEKLNVAMLSKLRSMSVYDFKDLPDVSEGLENRIYSAVRRSTDINGILEKVKTKRYTYSRIKRILLCAFLGIKKSDIKNGAPYIRVLGFNKNGAMLLKQAKEKSTLPIVTKSSDIKNLGDYAERVFALECFGRDMFSLTLPEPDECGKVMTDKIIVL